SGGNEGLLPNCGVKGMTAGRGLVHSELPEQEDGRLGGFQLWLNLPARDNMCPPGYRDIQSGDIPEACPAPGVLVRVLAGGSHGVAGVVQRDVTEPLYLDVHFAGAGAFSQPLAPSLNAFLYVYRGEVKVGDTAVPAGKMAILENAEEADGVVMSSDGPAK